MMEQNDSTAYHAVRRSRRSQQELIVGTTSTSSCSALAAATTLLLSVLALPQCECFAFCLNNNNYNPKNYALGVLRKGKVQEMAISWTDIGLGIATRSDQNLVEDALYSDFSSLDGMDSQPKPTPMESHSTVTTASSGETMSTTASLSSASLSSAATTKIKVTSEKTSTLSSFRGDPTKTDAVQQSNGGAFKNNNTMTSPRRSARRRQRLSRSEMEARQRSMSNSTMSRRGPMNIFSTLCKHELLSKNEEVILGREIQTLVHYDEIREDLEITLCRLPTYTEWAAAIHKDMTVPQLKKQIRRSQRAKVALTESNIRLVVSIANKYQIHHPTLTFNDLYQEGIVGLNTACEKFNPELGFRFSTYATWWIKQRVLSTLYGFARSVPLPPYVYTQLREKRRVEKYLRAELGRPPSLNEVASEMGKKPEKILRLERFVKFETSMQNRVGGKKMKGSGAGNGGADGSLSVGDFVKDEGPDPMAATNKDILKDAIRGLLSSLPRGEQTVIRMRFGLDDGKPRSSDQIAAWLDVGRERIRRIENAAMDKLRLCCKDNGLKELLEKLEK